MKLLDKIIEGSSIIFEGNKYRVLGKGFYVTQDDPNTIYAKILLSNHNVLVISPEDNIAYFGKNVGQISDFDSFSEQIEYNQKKFTKVASDYQIMIDLSFGSPLDVEGEVAYWDYEYEDEIISIAVVSRTKKRADVIAKYIDLESIEVFYWYCKFY